MSKAERWQALVFLLVGVVLILGAASVLTGFPFARATASYYVEFNEAVTGLETGSPVRYRGVKCGKVANLELAGGDRVRVTMALRQGTPVTTATKARFASTGLLGPYFIELYAGPASATPPSPLAPESAIPADQSTMRRLIDGGTNLLEHLNTLSRDLERWTSDDNRLRIEKLLDTTTKTVADLDSAIVEIRPEAVRLASKWADLGGQLSAAVAENRESFRLLVEESSAAARNLRAVLAGGHVERTADEAQRLMTAAREEIRETGGALRTYLDQNALGPLLERAVKSLERLETTASTALGAVEAETVTTARAELGPALRSLREATRSLQELLGVLRNDPTLLILSEPRPEIRPPVPAEKK